MSDASSPAKFGWRERWKRAGKLFGLGLVSVFVVELVSLVFLALNWGLGGELNFGAALEALASPLGGSFWALYSIFGLPVAVAHALGSLAWTPGTKPLAANVGLTLVTGVVMVLTSYGNPLVSYAFAILVLILGHGVCASGPRPKSEGAPAA